MSARNQPFSTDGPFRRPVHSMHSAAPNRIPSSGTASGVAVIDGSPLALRAASSGRLRITADGSTDDELITRQRSVSAVTDGRDPDLLGPAATGLSGCGTPSAVRPALRPPPRSPVIRTARGLECGVARARHQRTHTPTDATRTEPMWVPAGMPSVPHAGARAT